MQAKQIILGIGLALSLGGYTMVGKAQPLPMFNTPALSGSNFVVSWSGQGTLQTSTNLHGQWVNVVSNVTSVGNAFIPIASGARFARIVGVRNTSDILSLLPDGAAPGTPFSPLKIISATAQLIPPTALANSLVTITVDTNIQVPLSNSFSLVLNDNAVTFTGGGGVFTANALLDTNLMVAANNSLASMSFTQRFNLTIDKNSKQVTGTNVVTAFNISNLLVGATIPILTLGGLPCSGVAGAYDSAKTVMITDTAVVNDPARTWDPCTPGAGTPGGVWTFGFLMSQICNQPATGIKPSEFVKNWLESFANARVVNGEVVPANPNVKTMILDPWLAASALDGGTTLDLNKAPFRLLAIDNRLDLRANTTYGGFPPVKNECDPPCMGGESRFIFAATDPNSPCATTLPFIVILESCNPGDCDDWRALAQKWAHLDTFGSFDAAYRAELEAITATFSLANAFPNRSPNKSALNALRVNEFLGGILSGQPNVSWRLYEFKLAANGPDAGHLRPAPVAQTPAIVLNKNANHTVNELIPLSAVPLFFGPQGTLLVNEHALGGWSPIHSSLPWNGSPSVPTLARHTWALRTCSGCHGSEAPANPIPDLFTHIGGRLPGGASPRSQFLTGVTGFPDPVSGAVGPYSFHELADRVQKLNALATCGCNNIFSIAHDTTLFVDPNIFAKPVQIGNMGTFVH